MTVEPQAHPSPVPLDLVDGFETLLALPTEGCDDLRAAITPCASEALGLLAVRRRSGIAKDAAAKPASRTAPTRARSPSTSGRSAVARTRSS